jgi:hypothetical protein
MHAILRPEDPELPHVLGRTGIASVAVYQTALSWNELERQGFPQDAVKTTDRVDAAPGYDVGDEPDFR